MVQQTLIASIVVLGMGGFTFKKDFLKNEYLPMIGTTLLTLILCVDGIISRIDGLVLLGCFAAYMYYLWIPKSDILYSRKGEEGKQKRSKGRPGGHGWDDHHSRGVLTLHYSERGR